MWEDFIEHGMKWLFGLLSSGFVALVAYVRRKFREVKAIKNSQLALLHDKLRYWHKKSCADGWIDVDDLETVTVIFGAIVGVGGNGVDTKLYDDIKALPNFPPRERGERK